MEVCLPADFYKLRDELPVDWRDASSHDHVNEFAHTPARDMDLTHADSINSCADPAWRVF